MSDKRLTLTEDLHTAYCIPNWLRDEQIRVNMASCKGRIQAVYDPTPEPMALVNFGPSLNDTWEQIKGFKYVMTCSGAHKFLVERGIIPTHHIDVDPRPHKVTLMGQPQQETQYLIASTCHPDLFRHLEGFNLKLWHIFDTSAEGLRLLPHGEWAITGGCSVGVRTLTLARFLGFTELHIFGMDGCFREKSHAADHPNPPGTSYTLEYDGKEYKTTPAVLAAVKNTWHELDMMKDVKATFYGEGLVQAMAKNYVRKDLKDRDIFIGFNKPELISAEYRSLNAQLHKENLAYGVGGGKHADTVKKLAAILAKDKPMVGVLDYGCGKGYLAKALDFPIAEYDPAIHGKDESPRPADLCVCSDVLEHIEPDRIDIVLDDLRRVTRQLGFFVIHTKAAGKTLPDGRNTHLIQHGKSWWQRKLKGFFTVGKIFEVGPELHVLVVPKKK